MGTSRSAAQLASKLDGFARTVPDANLAATKAAAQLVKDATLQRARTASGGDLKLSKVGKTGGRLNVHYRVDGKVSANAVVRAVGPWQLVENRVRPHLIGPKRVKGGTRLKRGAVNRTGMKRRERAIDEGTAIYGTRDVLSFGNGQFARYAPHPGVPVGKKPWAKGIAEAKPKTAAVFQDGYHRALIKSFR